MVECPDGLKHPILLRPREVLIHRETDHLAGVAIGDRETARRVAQMFEAFLLIERDRIVYLGLDAMVETVFVELVASLGEHHVEMVDMLHIVSARGHAYA